MKKRFPRLAVLATAFLPVSCSSTPAERGHRVTGVVLESIAFELLAATVTACRIRLHGQVMCFRSTAEPLALSTVSNERCFL